MAAEARDLLHEAALGVDHQFAIALIPEIVTIGERPRNATAIGLDGVLAYEFRLEGWQVQMPEHDRGFVLRHPDISPEHCD